MNNAEVMKTGFILFGDTKRSKKYRRYAEDSIKGIESESDLSEVFFSPENMNIIQNGLIREVYKATNKLYLIKKQSEQDLMVVMRAIFLRDAVHSGCVKNQVAVLNNIIVQSLVPNIVCNINAWMGYMKRINNPLDLMDRPKSVTFEKSRTLPSITSLW